jgi:hypothetical protein
MTRDPRPERCPAPRGFCTELLASLTDTAAFLTSRGKFSFSQVFTCDRAFAAGVKTWCAVLGARYLVRGTR